MAADERDEDVVLLGPPLPDGEGAAVLRKRGDRVEVGAVRPAEEGKPVYGEIVRLRPRERQPRVCDVEVLYDGRSAKPPLPAEALAKPSRPSAPAPAGATRGASPPRLAAGDGPPQVASEAYRKGWEAVFGRHRPARRARSALN
jgi:hypothetical protein